MRTYNEIKPIKIKIPKLAARILFRSQASMFIIESNGNVNPTNPNRKIQIECKIEQTLTLFTNNTASQHQKDIKLIPIHQETTRNNIRNWDEDKLLELAIEISLTSLGSSQTFPFPHLRTLEASLFWSFRETIVAFLRSVPRSPSTVLWGRGGSEIFIWDEIRWMCV